MLLLRILNGHVTIFCSLMRYRFEIVDLTLNIYFKKRFLILKRVTY